MALTEYQSYLHKMQFDCQGFKPSHNEYVSIWLHIQSDQQICLTETRVLLLILDL